MKTKHTLKLLREDGWKIGKPEYGRHDCSHPSVPELDLSVVLVHHNPKEVEQVNFHHQDHLILVVYPEMGNIAFRRLLQFYVPG